MKRAKQSPKATEARNKPGLRLFYFLFYFLRVLPGAEAPIL
ncbi:hypothetical protein LEP1GSC073_3657 [Leptospira noguchii str. Cascata]|nr:hypothetical protein LEP1GSC073_3657 [Leptospira noguchii str. Cascata]